MLELQLKILYVFNMFLSYTIILHWTIYPSGDMILYGTYINIISEKTKRLRVKVISYNGSKQIKTYSYIGHTTIIYPKKTITPPTFRSSYPGYGFQLISVCFRFLFSQQHRSKDSRYQYFRE